jgi:hypothetical protein
MTMICGLCWHFGPRPMPKVFTVTRGSGIDPVMNRRTQQISQVLWTEYIFLVRVPSGLKKKLKEFLKTLWAKS